MKDLTQVTFFNIIRELKNEQYDIKNNIYLRVTFVFTLTAIIVFAFISGGEKGIYSLLLLTILIPIIIRLFIDYSEAKGNLIMKLSYEAN